MLHILHFRTVPVHRKVTPWAHRTSPVCGPLALPFVVLCLGGIRFWRFFGVDFFHHFFLICGGHVGVEHDENIMKGREG